MINISPLLKKTAIPILAIIMITGVSACGSNAPATPAIQTVEVTQEVTRLVMQEVTQEVTQIVEIQVTSTPAPTPEPTSTPDPNATVSPVLPQATLPDHTDCLYGPASWYEYKSSFPAGQPVDVLGKSEDGAWLNVEEVGGWNACWINTSEAQFVNAQIEALPVVQPVLPVDYYDLASPYASTRRKGDEVTLSWKAVPMSVDEIRGYLIRAELCQGGQIVPQEIFIPMTYEENKGTITYTVTDEAGCSAPSQVHMISYTRRGFAGYYQTGKLGWERVYLPPHP